MGGGDNKIHKYKENSSSNLLIGIVTILVLANVAFRYTTKSVKENKFEGAKVGGKMQSRTHSTADRLALPVDTDDGEGAANAGHETRRDETAVVVIGNDKYSELLVKFLHDLRDESRGNYQGTVAIVVSADITDSQRSMLRTEYQVTFVEHEWGKTKPPQRVMCPRYAYNST
jgi:hypothetical protein